MTLKRKKILYCITQAELGGAQQYVLTLAQHFHGTGHDVLIVAGGERDDYLFSKSAMMGIPTKYLPSLVPQISPSKDLKALGELKKIGNSFEPDIVHLNSSKISVLGSFAFKRSRRVKKTRVVYTAHGFVFNEGRFLRKLYGRALERYTARMKDAIICVSHYDRAQALKHSVGSIHSLHTIHNGIDLKGTHFLPREEAQEILGLSGTVVGTIANHYATKGLEYLIKAAKRMLKDSPDVTFAVIGDGPERVHLEKAVTSHGLEERFLLLGPKTQAAGFLKAFDVFVLPSVKEGFPYALLEAMVAGIPIVATNVGGVPEIITDKKTGVLIPPRDPRALADAIALLLNDTTATQKYAQAGLEDVQQFSQERLLTQTSDLYGV